MKNHFRLAWISLLLFTVILSGCGGGSGRGRGNTYTGVEFTMIQIAVPSGGYTLPSDVNNSEGTAVITNGFYLGQTEVTYELWSTVRTWAEANGYSFPTGEGVMGAGTGSLTNQHPVSTISWWDAMVWCNALTEYYNAHGGDSLDCVYYTDNQYKTPLRVVSGEPVSSESELVSGTVEQPYIKAATNGNIAMANCTAKGFRLPTNIEWLLAACYINDKDGDGILDDGEFYPGTYASGADAAYNVTATTDYDGNNVICSTGNVSVFGNSSTGPVKSKYPNKLGFYDMSGNVNEWCFDWYKIAAYRVRHGGCYVDSSNFMMLGTKSSYNTYSASSENGFRIARTK